MPFPFTDLMVTPEVVDALANVLFTASEHRPEGDHDVKQVERWLSYARSELHREWQELPAGDHRKATYADVVWSWSDQDIAGTTTAITDQQMRDLLQQRPEQSRDQSLPSPGDPLG